MNEPTEIIPLNQAQKDAIADLHKAATTLSRLSLSNDLGGCDFAGALGRGEGRLYVEIELATFHIQFTGEWPGYFERTKLREIVIERPKLSS